NRDDLLAAALDRARKFPLPRESIAGPIFIPEDELPNPLRPPAGPLPDFTERVKAEAGDRSRPQVVSVSPSDGSTSIATSTALRIRFDRPMNPLALHLDWLAGGFLECDNPRYDPTKYEFTIPMRLPPAVLHQIVINKNF